MPRTLNDIIPPSRRKQMEDVAPVEEREAGEVAPPPSRPPHRSLHPRRRFPFTTALIALVIIGLSVGALYLFSGARVTVDPSTNRVTVSGNYTASSVGGNLPFQILTVQKTATQSVPGDGSETVKTAAQGTVVISNTQSTPQRLITNTRLETAAGLVYRIHSSVVVPAAKAGVPGTVTATVYADVAGDSYNIGPATFTLPGLAGSPAFTAVTAKSTGGMTGGFVGTRPKVSQAVQDSTHATLKTALTPDLLTAVKAQVPAGYTLLPGAVFNTYQDLPDTASATGSVDVREQGTATAIVFPDSAIAGAIAAQSLTSASYNGEPVTIPDPSQVTLSATAGAPVEGVQTFSFSLSGTATIVWTVDPARIASAVAGKSRESAQVVLSGYPEVKRALLVLKPFWKAAFPADPKDIKVIVNAPSGS
jgi:hypothetical protein